MTLVAMQVLFASLKPESPDTDCIALGDAEFLKTRLVYN